MTFNELDCTAHVCRCERCIRCLYIHRNPPLLPQLARISTSSSATKYSAGTHLHVELGDKVPDFIAQQEGRTRFGLSVAADFFSFTQRQDA